MPDKSHLSEPPVQESHPENTPKGLFHGLVTGPAATTTEGPATNNNAIENRDAVQQQQQQQRQAQNSETHSQSERKPLLEQVKESIFTKLFTPAPDPQQEDEPKLLFDQDTRFDGSNDTTASSSLNQISSTEASIQTLDLSPVPDDDGPQMIFEDESTIRRAKE